MRVSVIGLDTRVGAMLSGQVYVKCLNRERERERERERDSNYFGREINR